MRKTTLFIFAFLVAVGIWFVAEDSDEQSGVGRSAETESGNPRRKPVSALTEMRMTGGSNAFSRYYPIEGWECPPIETVDEVNIGDTEFFVAKDRNGKVILMRQENVRPVETISGLGGAGLMGLRGQMKYRGDLVFNKVVPVDDKKAYRLVAEARKGWNNPSLNLDFIFISYGRLDSSRPGERYIEEWGAIIMRSWPEVPIYISSGEMRLKDYFFDRRIYVKSGDSLTDLRLTLREGLFRGAFESALEIGISRLLANPYPSVKY